jgi:hypothetical protein
MPTAPKIVPAVETVDTSYLETLNASSAWLNNVANQDLNCYDGITFSTSL